MKRLQWLLALADKKPLLFSIAILIIAIVVLAKVVKNRDAGIDNCNDEKRLIQLYYERKFDSLATVYRIKEEALNTEVKETLNSIIEDYKDQLEEQKNINRKINTTITNTKKLIRRNRNQIKNLQQ